MCTANLTSNSTVNLAILTGDLTSAVMLKKQAVVGIASIHVYYNVRPAQFASVIAIATTMLRTGGPLL